MRQLVKKVQGHWKNFAGVLDKPETTHYKGVTPARGQHGSALDAQIAQLVEQRIENPRVAGSIPALGTTLFRENSEVVCKRLSCAFCILAA